MRRSLIAVFIANLLMLAAVTALLVQRCRTDERQIHNLQANCAKLAQAVDKNASAITTLSETSGKQSADLGELAGTMQRNFEAQDGLNSSVTRCLEKQSKVLLLMGKGIQ